MRKGRSAKERYETAIPFLGAAYEALGLVMLSLRVGRAETLLALKACTWGVMSLFHRITEC